MIFSSRAPRREFYEDNTPRTCPRDDSAEWEFAIPTARGVRSSALASAGDALQKRSGMRSLLVQRGGRLIYERYYGAGSARQSNNVHSASKSILQALIGIAVAHGRIGGLDDSIAAYLPRYLPAGSPKRDITVRHLLTMCSGLRWTEDETEYEIEKKSDWVRAILDLPYTPGNRFHYSTGNTHLLSAILQAATGTTTAAFAQEYLFQPLGIAPTRWGADPQGISSGGYNLYLTARELAKFGQLYLNGGVWNGYQVVPAETVQQAFTAVSTKPEDPRIFYASGWWGTHVAGQVVHFAWGWGGQYTCVVPDLDLVVTATQDTQGNAEKVEKRELDIRDFLKRHILKADLAAG